MLRRKSTSTSAWVPSPKSAKATVPTPSTDVHRRRLAATNLSNASSGDLGMVHLPASRRQSMKWHTYAVVITAMTDMASRMLSRFPRGRAAVGASAPRSSQTRAPAVSPAVSPNSSTTRCKLEEQNRDEVRGGRDGHERRLSERLQAPHRHSGAHTSTTTCTLSTPGRVQYHCLVCHPRRMAVGAPGFLRFPSVVPSSARR